jgi:hypothetical protein
MGVCRRGHIRKCHRHAGTPEVDPSWDPDSPVLTQRYLPDAELVTAAGSEEEGLFPPLPPPLPAMVLGGLAWCSGCVDTVETVKWSCDLSPAGPFLLACPRHQLDYGPIAREL